DAQRDPADRDGLLALDDRTGDPVALRRAGTPAQMACGASQLADSDTAWLSGRSRIQYAGVRRPAVHGCDERGPVQFGFAGPDHPVVVGGCPRAHLETAGVRGFVVAGWRCGDR